MIYIMLQIKHLKKNYTGNIEEAIAILKDSEIIKIRCDSYKKKYEYANDIDYNEIMQCIEEIVKVIIPVAVQQDLYKWYIIMNWKKMRIGYLMEQA